MSANLIFPINSNLVFDEDINVIGEAAPIFELPDLDGKQVSLNTYKGQYLVIHIATTWFPF